MSNGGYERKNILIIRTDRLGDVVLSTPVIKAVRDNNPHAFVSFMVQPYAMEVVQFNPYLDEVIKYDKHGQERGLWGNIKFIMKLRKKKFDLAIILHPTKRANIITFLAGVKERVGYDKDFGFLLTRRIPHTKQLGQKHEIEYNLDVARAAGIEPRDKDLLMPVSDMSERSIKEVLDKAGIKQEDFIVVINPAASCKSKRWPAEKFAKMADRLIENHNVKIVIISGLMDRIFGDRVYSEMRKRSINLSGRTNISEMASLLKHARLFISNDSGPVHVACAVGTPVIAIFGRNDKGLSPKRWGPSGKDDIVLHKEVGCLECLAHRCREGFKCLDAITVEDAVSAADSLIAKVKAKASGLYGKKE